MGDKAKVAEEDLLKEELIHIPESVQEIKYKEREECHDKEIFGDAVSGGADVDNDYQHENDYNENDAHFLVNRTRIGRARLDVNERQREIEGYVDVGNIGIFAGHTSNCECSDCYQEYDNSGTEGYSHCVLLDDNGIVYGSGGNRYGQLGIPNTNTTTSKNRLYKNDSDDIPHCVSRFTRIPLRAAVIMVATGKHHTLYLLEDNTVWGNGKNKYSCLGLDSSIIDVLKPKKLCIVPEKLPSDINDLKHDPNTVKGNSSTCINSCDLINISDDISHSTCVTQNNQYGSSECTCDKGEELRFTQIGAGADFSQVVDNQDRLWSTISFKPRKCCTHMTKHHIKGDSYYFNNTNGEQHDVQLCLNEYLRNRKKVEWSLERENVKLLRVAHKVSIVIDYDNKVWQSGQYAHDEYRRDLPPREILADKTIIDVAISDRFYVALDTSAKIWVWGSLFNTIEPINPIRSTTSVIDSCVSSETDLTEIVDVKACSGNFYITFKDFSIWSVGVYKYNNSDFGCVAQVGSYYKDTCEYLLINDSYYPMKCVYYIDDCYNQDSETGYLNIHDDDDDNTSNDNADEVEQEIVITKDIISQWRDTYNSVINNTRRDLELVTVGFGNSVILVDSNGQLYALGENRCNQLGISNGNRTNSGGSNYLYKLVKISDFPGSIKSRVFPAGKSCNKKLSVPLNVKGSDGIGDYRTDLLDTKCLLGKRRTETPERKDPTPKKKYT